MFYHGSPIAGIKVLEPRPSNVIGGEKAVFATTDKLFAIAMSVPASDKDIEMGYINGKFTITEMKPGAFKLLDKPSVIYTLKDTGFKKDSRLMRVEVISKNHTPVVKEERISNVFNELKRLGTDVESYSLANIRKYAEFAPGIPQKKVEPLPTVNTRQKWKYSVQFHQAEKAGDHYDLRLIDQQGKAHSWAIPKAKLPKPGEKVLAIRQPTHTSGYALGFQGTIKDGYGKGQVRIVEKGECEVYHIGPDSVKFDIGNNEYVLLLIRGKDNLLVNKRTSMKKEARLTTPEERAKMRQYRQKNKAQLKLKAKRRNRDIKQGTKRVKKRLGTASGGYSFVEQGPQNTHSMATIPSMNPVTYKPIGLFPSSGIKVGSEKRYYAAPVQLNHGVRKGQVVGTDIHSALILAVHWAPDQLEEPPEIGKLPLYLGFLENPPSDHPLFLYEIECKTEEGLTFQTAITEEYCKEPKLIASYPSWKAILSSKENLRNI